ncbi:photosynthetic reaction center cytochrome PufC [Tropicimonas sp. IMCC34043]|uniref:photosynthetic reaction center cytochrome PufC n=1 Tax=Tropicimonas sp. IMCC34043 TaxID=2248760 RepID=UPI000E2755B0|nr:photosynthetic reaction center cytochrome PufC [Tropicimonas sp. IMCC34043]
MFPKWFDEWNRKNPTDIEGPAILVGAAGGAVVVAAAIVAIGNPWATETQQTGPRGIGMGVVEFKSAAPDPTIALYTTAAPVVPQGGEERAGDVHEFAGPLADLTVENYDRVVGQLRTWTGIPDLLEQDNYQTQVAWRMIEMTQNLNENWDGHVNVSGEAGVNCYTCHRGQPVPSDIWFRIDPMLESVAGWSANQNFATMMTVSTSLPHDALQKFLVDGETIKVHDLEPRVKNLPGDPMIQQAERTYSLMNNFANSMGVNCTFCHNTRAFYDVAEVTPQWATATLGIQMVLELNNDYMLPLTPLFPPERLGPKHADAPKIACATCHKGYQKPLDGENMIADWPELASSEPPTYN